MKVRQLDRAGKLIRVWNKLSDAAEALDVPPTNISAVIYNRRKSCGGYLWEPAEQVDSDIVVGGVQETIDVATDNGTYSTTVEYSMPVKIQLSALGEDGRIMDIDQYCDFHGLPREDISSYKLITHTGVPYYNTVFKEVTSDVIADIDFDSIVSKFITTPATIKVEPKKATTEFSRLIYTDVHVGMDPNPDGNSLYGGRWDKEEFYNRIVEMAKFVLANSTSTVLHVDDLGDYLDGQGGRTTRGGHEIPQNMTDEDCFDVGITGKVMLADMLAPHFEKLVFRNVVNDNHGGSFSYFVNSAAKSIIEAKYGSHVEYHIQRKFIDHYFLGDHCFVTCHGKDSKDMKYALKPYPTKDNLSTVDNYCKNNGIYRKSNWVHFEKGDSHQMLFDYSSSDDFNYMNYPAFSPSSGWVQTNFKKGSSGFILQNFDGSREGILILPHYFDWEK